MADNAEPLTQAPEAPQADYSADTLAAAFANAQPYNHNAEPAPVAVPEPAVIPADAAHPAPAAPAVAIATESAPLAEVQPDYAGWLKSQELPEDVAAIKTALQTTDALKANQRTPQDLAFEKLMSDPYAAVQFVKLQSTDYNTLSDRELHAATYAHAHPELKPDVAQIRARREYDAEYAAAEFDDPEDPAVAEAKVLVADMRAQAIQTMEGAKTAAREAVLANATPQAEGPTAEQAQVQALQEAHAQAWDQGVANVSNGEPLQLEYDVDGQKVALAFDTKNPAYVEFMAGPMQYLEKLVSFDPQNPKATDFDKLAEIGAWLTQRDVMLKNTLAVGKSSLGAVIPLSQAVNPISGAPQAPNGLSAPDDMVAAAIRAASQQTNRNSIYN